MNYGVLFPTDPFRRTATDNSKDNPPRRRLLLLFLSLAAILLVAAIAAATIFVSVSRHARESQPAKVSEAISKTCAMTLYPSLCLTSFLHFPGAAFSSQSQLLPISLNLTLQHLNRAVYRAAAISHLPMDTLTRAAYDDCLELLVTAADHVRRSLAGAAAPVVRTYLSAALTNHDTCSEGLNAVDPGPLKTQMKDFFKDLPEMASNSLAIFSALKREDDFFEVPVQNRRKLMAMEDRDLLHFPTWLNRKDRRLLELPPHEIQANFIVSKDGSTKYKSIQEAVKAAPEKSSRRIIIYVMSGRYEEIVRVGRKKTNIMIIGDGKGRTVVSGNLSFSNHLTTYHTATFAAMGEGFLARDLTFENTAGPEKHQSVALRISADRAVVYRCDILGYQDTLYAHSLRQFYRNCNIHGTVDFIFGNAAAVFQNCSIYARKPLQNQRNTITAHGRKDPNQNTGFSLHDCRILPSPELRTSSAGITYLGRPWKPYSRAVFMLSYIDRHVNPRGWLDWNGDFATDSVYYGEYMNYGPGAGVEERVKWPGFRVISLEKEADKFTVGRFIQGSSWLPSTGVAFLAGLTE